MTQGTFKNTIAAQCLDNVSLFVRASVSVVAGFGLALRQLQNYVSPTTKNKTTIQDVSSTTDELPAYYF